LHFLTILIATSFYVAMSMPIKSPVRFFIYSGLDNLNWYLWFMVNGIGSRMQGEGSLDLLWLAYQEKEIFY
jgi:hypothetical protein